MDIDLSIPSPTDQSVQGTSESKGGVDEDPLSWRVKFEMMGTDLQEMMKRGQGDPRKRRERWANVLRQLLDAQMLLGQSIDQMRDCLLKFKADGYPVDNDVL